MDVSCAQRASPRFQPSENFALKRRTESLYALQPVLLGSDLKFITRIDTELFM
jgi:hypothetical protein